MWDERARFVGLRETRVADHIGGENCGKSSLFTLLSHISPQSEVGSV